MDQITSINNAINAQAHRVDAIRRALMPLPGKLHQINASTISDMKTISDRVRPATKAIATQQMAMPHLIQITGNVINSLVALTERIGKKVDHPLEANFDGMTTSVLQSEALEPGTPHFASTIQLALEQSVIEMSQLSQDVTFINSDIIDLLLVAASAPTLEPEAIHYEDLIAPSGFCYLEKPIIVGDYHPVTGEYTDEIVFGWRAFSWNVTSHGLNFVIYSDWGIYRHIFTPSIEDIEPAIRKSLPGFAAWRDDDIFVADVQRWAFDKVWGTPGSWDKRSKRGPLNASDQEQQLIGSALGDIPLEVNPHVELFRKFFLSMMRFCWQNLLVSERATVTRQVRRAAVRDLGKDFNMNILRLRRIKRVSSSDGETGEGHRLDHRIVVRGYWQNHYYSDRGPCLLEDGTSNPESHRRIWVNSHVKGPEGAPFVHKHKINALVR
jgi:hypothetical protein